MHPHVRRAHRALKKYFIPHKGNKYHPHALHTKHTALYALLFTILKVVLIVVAVLVPAEAFIAPDVLADQGAKIIARTNQVRVEQGLPALKTDSLLIRSATAKATDMGQKEYFSHVSPDGHRLGYFLARAGYAYSEAGENLAMGFSDADGAMNGWMKSPTHYANLVDPTFTDLGVGLEGGIYQGKPTVFVAQHFGLRQATIQAAPIEKIQAPTPAPAPVVEPVNQHPAPVDSNAQMQIASRPMEAKKPEAAKPVQVAVTAPVKPVVPRAQPVSPATPAPVPAPVQVVAAPVIQPASTIAEAPSVEDVRSDLVPYRYDTERSYVGWEDKEDRTLIEAQAVIEGEVESASVVVNGYTFGLQSKPDNVFVGGMTVPETSDALFKVVLPPTLKVTLKNGETYVEAIEWKNPKVISETPWQKYLQTKSWLSKSIPVFEIVHLFYIVALAVLSLALIINIVIEARKQHPHVIVQTLALLGMLVIYIKF